MAKKSKGKSKKKAAKKASSSASVVRSSVKEQREWQARNDLETLQRAEDIRKDSGRLTAAQRQAQEQMEALKKVKKVKAKE